MICFCLLICLIFGGSSATNNSVSFPDDSSSSEPVRPRLGWTLLGDYLKALETIFGGRFRVPIQTQTVTTTQTIPTMTDNDPTDFPSTFPPLPSMASPFPEFDLSKTESSRDIPFPTGIVTPGESYSAAASEPSLSDVDLTMCECMPLGLCVNQTTRNGGTTRIVTTPPKGTVCNLGEVYCCTRSSKLGCGLPNIVPGVSPKDGQADLGEFPWSAIILTKDNTYVGGGVLIDETHVLTAAHKVARYGNGASLKIRLGDWDLSKEDEPVKHLEVKISKIVNHPKFEANTLKNDISVITLATPVTTFMQPYPQINTICLPEAKDVFTGSRCKVAGWGKDQFNGKYQNIIKKVEVPVLSGTDCQTKLRNTKLGNSFVLDTNSFVCAGGEAGRDACTGDGGNALACYDGEEYYLAGITAGGIECGNQNVPGLYVNVMNYLTWIYTEINGSAEGIDPRRKPT